MNSSLTFLERTLGLSSYTPVLAQRGFTCTLLALEPGADLPLPKSVHSPDDSLLFVVEGDVALQTPRVTTLVTHGAACVVQAAEAPLVAARGATLARVLHVAIPPRSPEAPAIVRLTP